MGDLSPHFSRREFTCKGGGLSGHPAHDVIVLAPLVAALEELRRLCGGTPLRIVSGHRCGWYNVRVGGARASRHLYGDAADIPVGYAGVGQAEAAGFSGIGNKGMWAIHVDTRGYPARWSY